MNYNVIFKISLFALILAVMASCDYDRKTTGWEYFRDMAHSPAYESYTPNPNFPDGKTMQPPVEGTIPRGFDPYSYAKNDTDRAIAAVKLINPIEATPENLARGKKEFQVFCAQCHGDLGDGQGRLYTSKKYPFPPASLLSDKMKVATEGEIYHVITVGNGIMSAHGSMITPDDRWKISLYIKRELQKRP